jgi:hypothetical protein
MRSLKYLLTVISLVSVLSANAQIFDKEWGKQPVVQMRSTSVMAYSGSTLPMAAATGVTMVSGSVPSANAPASYRPGHIRRIGEDEGWGDDGEDTKLPGEPMPVGDVFFPLMLLAFAYACFRKYRAEKTIE